MLTAHVHTVLIASKEVHFTRVSVKKDTEARIAKVTRPKFNMIYLLLYTAFDKLLPYSSESLWSRI